MPGAIKIKAWSTGNSVSRVLRFGQRSDDERRSARQLAIEERLPINQQENDTASSRTVGYGSIRVRSNQPETERQ